MPVTISHLSSGRPSSLFSSAHPPPVFPPLAAPSRDIGVIRPVLVRTFPFCSAARRARAGAGAKFGANCRVPSPERGWDSRLAGHVTSHRPAALPAAEPIADKAREGLATRGAEREESERRERKRRSRTRGWIKTSEGEKREGSGGPVDVGKRKLCGCCEKRCMILVSAFLDVT